MSGILICAQQKGTAWAEVKPRIYTSTHLAPDLYRTHQSNVNSNQVGPRHVFPTWGWRYLISGCQRLLVKLLQQRIGLKNWILHPCWYHTRGNMKYVWRDSSLTEQSFLQRRQFKKDKSQPPHILSKGHASGSTKLLVEVNAIKWDVENLWAQRGVSCANLFALYFFNLSFSVCMKLNMYYSLCDTDSHRHTETCHKYVLDVEWH